MSARPPKDPIRTAQEAGREQGEPPERAEATYVEAFTNCTLWKTGRIARLAPGDAAYAPGDRLELCYAAERPDLAGLAPEDVAQSVYGTLNPRHAGEAHSLAYPSLSMGDVVSCRNGGREWSLSVEWEGFAPVSPPVFASEDDHAAYRRKAGR